MAQQYSARQRLRCAQSGYVLATTALLLLPLMVFAAFAVDVGSWYVEADEAQRAADAAALAAVVHLPAQADAETAAVAIVQQNGYPDAVLVPTGSPFSTTETRPQVRVDQLANNQVRVSIQATGESYFGKVVLDDIDIERYASAEYNLPVPMGSPYNILGYGISYQGEPASNVLLTLEGYCNAPMNGDRRGNALLNRSGCASIPPTVDASGVAIDTYEKGLAWIQNSMTDDVLHPLFVDPGGGDPPEGRRGYRFVIEVPPGTGPTTIHIFDAPACNGTGVRGISEGADQADGSDQIRLTFQVWDATATPLLDSDIVPLGSLWRPTQPADNNNVAGTQCNAWTEIPGIGALAPGRYYLDVRNDETYRGGFSSGTNFFAIQARENGVNTVYDSRIDSTAPQVYALEWLPVRAALPQSAGSTDAIFQLADIDPAIHNGKVLEISMYDPSEGMRQIQILDPAGDPLYFEWDTDDDEQFSSYHTGHNGDPFSAGYRPAQSAGCDPAGWCLDVVGQERWLWTEWGTGDSSVFNGRQLYIRVPLGTGTNSTMSWSPAANPDDHWFEVRYTCIDNDGNGCDSVSDVTTWRVRVIGDPVRLTE